MKIFALLTTSLLLCGCAGQLGRNAAKFDKIEDVRIDQLIGNNLTRTPFDQRIVYLNARCETRRDGKTSSYLYTETILPDEFTLQPGESLVLNVDGEVMSFASTNAPTAFNGRPRYSTTFYQVPNEVLTKIGLGRQVSVRLKGTNMVVDRKLTSRNLQRFREFSYFHKALAERAEKI